MAHETITINRPEQWVSSAADDQWRARITSRAHEVLRLSDQGDPQAILDSLLDDFAAAYAGGVAWYALGIGAVRGQQYVVEARATWVQLEQPTTADELLADLAAQVDPAQYGTEFTLVSSPIGDAVVSHEYLTSDEDDGQFVQERHAYSFVRGDRVLLLDARCDVAGLYGEWGLELERLALSLRATASASDGGDVIVELAPEGVAP